MALNTTFISHQVCYLKLTAPNKKKFRRVKGSTTVNFIVTQTFLFLWLFRGYLLNFKLYPHF